MKRGRSLKKFLVRSASTLLPSASLLLPFQPASGQGARKTWAVQTKGQGGPREPQERAALPHPGVPHGESLGAGPGPNGGAVCLDGPTFFCTEGWDRIPGARDRATGLWPEVTLKATGVVRVGDVQVKTRLPLPDHGKVRLLAVTASGEGETVRPAQPLFDSPDRDKT